MMVNFGRRSRILFAFALIIGARAHAHHAEALFDHSRTLSATGTLKSYLWANPHTLVYLRVFNAAGSTDVDVFEAGSVAVMSRHGWSPEMFKAGDTLTVLYHPRRDLKPGGMLLSVTTAKGVSFSWQPASMP